MSAEIGLVLTADARAMIKALKDAEANLRTFSAGSQSDLAKLARQAKDTDQALVGMGRGLSGADLKRQVQEINRGLGETGLTAKQTAAALRGVPAQITDIVVSLQGGQAPLTVLLQQGGQLKDMFGGVVPAVKALGGAIASMGRAMLANPILLAVSAIGALVLATRSASQEQAALRKAIADTGGAAGVTVDQLNGMAEAMGEGFGRTAGKARDALAVMVQTGRVGRADLQQFAQVAIDVEKATGQALEKTAENFAALGKDPLGASLRLSESMNYLTLETYKQIKAAVDLGQTQKAAAIAQQAYADAEEQRIRRGAENLGYIERAWKAVTGAVGASFTAMKEVWDWLKGLGSADPLSVQLAAAEKSAAELQKIVAQYSGTGMGEARKKELADKLALIDSIKEQIRLSKMAGDAEAERLRGEKKGIDAAIAADKAKADAKTKTAKAEKENLAILREGEKLAAEALKPYEQAAKLAESRLTALQIEAEAIKMMEGTNMSLAVAIEHVNIARLKEQQIKAADAQDEAVVAAIEKEIQARQELAKMIAGKEARQANEKAAKEAADAWTKTANTIREGLVDALMRGFQRGKSFGDELKRYLENMFNGIVLRPIIQAVVGGIGLGGAGGASANSGGFGDLMKLKNIAASGSSIMNFLSGKSMMSGAAGMWTRAGDWMSTSSNGTMANAGSWMQANPQMASYAGMAGNALAGYGIQKGISGEYKIGNGKLVDALTVAASAYFGPIAGVVAGVANRAFGMAAKQVTGESLKGSFGESGADTSMVSTWAQKGGWFRKNKSGTNITAVTGELDAYMDASIGSMFSATREAAKILGMNADEINGFTQSIDLNLKGLNEEQRTKAINDALGGFGDALAQKLGAESLDALTKFAAQVMQQRTQLENQLLQLQGNTTELRKRERDALHETNRALYDQIKALEDLRVVNERQAAVMAERVGLQGQLDQAMGNTAAIRERERMALDETNRALYDQIKALEDAKAIQEKWNQLGDAMISEVDRIRAAVKTQSMDYGLAAIQSDFAIATARARAGDQTAAGSLPGLSGQLLAAAERQTRTAAEFAFLQAQTAASLEATNSIVTGRPVSVNAPIATSTASEDTKAMRAQIEHLNARIAELNTNSTAENRAMVDLLGKMARLLDDVTQGGQSVSVTTRNGEKVDTV